MPSLPAKVKILLILAKTLEKKKINFSTMPSLPAKVKILLILAKTLEKQKIKFSRSALFYIKTKASLKYFVNDCCSRKKKSIWLHEMGKQIKRSLLVTVLQ